MASQGKPRETDLANAARQWYVRIIQPVAVIVLAALILGVAETALDFKTYMPVFQTQQRLLQERVDQEFARVDKRLADLDERLDRLTDRHRRYGSREDESVSFVTHDLAAL